MKKRKMKKFILPCVIAAAVIVAAAVPAARSASVEEAADSVQSIRDTVMQRALQCYVIEGAYPESLEYLEENYGLTINKKDYKVVYEPFAENLPPDVKVVYRHASEEDRT